MCLFLSLFISAQKNKEIIGEWNQSNKKVNKVTSTFSLKINSIKNDTILGSYCAITREGKKIDCSTDDNDYNLKIIKKNNYYDF